MRRSPSSLVNRSMTAPRRPVKRAPGKRMVDGKDFRLADEVRYVQRCAARHDGRIVTIGQLILFSTETGDAWLLDKDDGLAAPLARDGVPNPSTSKRPTPTSPSNGRGTTASRAMRSSTRTSRRAGPSHPRIPHAEVGARRARRARQLKFQIFLARYHTERRNSLSAPLRPYSA